MSQTVIEAVVQPSSQRLGIAPVAPPAEIPTVKRKGLKRVFLLGFIPGVGALYNGQYTKAAIHVGIFILLSTLNDVVPRSLRDTYGWVRIAFFFYMAFDAYHTAQKKN